MIAWVIAAVLAGAVTLTSVVIVRLFYRLTTATVLLEAHRALLDLHTAANASPEPNGPFVDEAPEGYVACGIDVVDAGGRVVGTVVVPVPSN